jgi:hypothetical protein
MTSMLFFLENLLNLPKVSIRNVIQEGKQAFLILSCQEEEVKCQGNRILFVTKNTDKKREI